MVLVFGARSAKSLVQRSNDTINLVSFPFTA